MDWYPWGDAAFEKARREDKPIFLSVGYSTCHWCHVMEHESFEDASVAEMLNRDYVAIKVDREERPDVDRVYMTFVQVTTGSGGWPMSVWLTPTLEPFYGGTYFPPTSRWGRPGFMEILDEIARVWREERGRVLQSATSIVERLRSLGGHTGDRVVPVAGVLDTAVQEFASAFDARRGGFGDAPKFPRPSELLFLLREHRRTGDDVPTRHRPCDAASHGARRHAGSRRRRIPPLLRRWRLAGAALREDALRPGPARAGLRRGGAVDGRADVRRRRCRHPGLRPARPHESGRRILFRRGRRQCPA